MNKVYESKTQAHNAIAAHVNKVAPQLIDVLTESLAFKQDGSLVKRLNDKLKAIYKTDDLRVYVSTSPYVHTVWLDVTAMHQVGKHSRYPSTGYYERHIFLHNGEEPINFEPMKKWRKGELEKAVTKRQELSRKIQKLEHERAALNNKYNF